MNLDHYKKAIEAHFSRYNMEGIYLAGGALTSIFSNNPINDLDLYFTDQETLGSFIDDSNGNAIAVTDKAISLNIKDGKSGYFAVQCIYFKYFEKAEDIFDTFDYTINMAAYDFSKKEFVFHQDFMKDLASKRLVFNNKTAFPFVSGVRVNKYLQRGYTISKSEHRKVLMAVSKLDLNDPKEFIHQVGGMYSMSAMVSILRWPEEKPFNADEALDSITEEAQTEPKLFFNNNLNKGSPEITWSCPRDYLVDFFLKRENYEEYLITPFWVEDHTIRGGDTELRAFTIDSDGNKRRMLRILNQDMCLIHLMLYNDMYDPALKTLVEMSKQAPEQKSVDIVPPMF